MKLKWMRFGFLTISSPDGKRSPPERFAFLVFYSLSDHLNLGVRLSSLKVTGQSIFWYYFHYPGRQGCPGDPSPSPGPPHSSQPGERSHSANLYDHSKFAIFNDRSQLDFYYYSLILISLGALVFPAINHQNWGDCIVPLQCGVWEQVWVSPRSLYVWTVTTLIVPTHARFWSISSSLLSQLFIALHSPLSSLQSGKHLMRDRERDKGWSLTGYWPGAGWAGGRERSETKH